MAESVIDSLRAADARVDVVVRAAVAAKLGLLGEDDLILGEVFDRLVDELHRVGAAASLVVGATRLLDRLDAVVAREHPVDIEWPDPDTTLARVPRDDDTTLLVALVDDRIAVDHDVDPCRYEYSIDEAEALGHALLRLVRLAREG